MLRSRLGPIVAVLIGCTARPPSTEPTVVPAAVQVEPRFLNLRAGDSAQLSAQVNDAVGQPIGGAPLSFETSDPVIVRVSSTGLASSAGGAGTARIVVSSGVTKAIVPVTVAPGSAVRVVKVGGDGQRGEVAASLEAPVSAKGTDSYGNPVPGAEVRFTALDGGSAGPPTAVTDAAGVASATWTLGAAPGVQRLTVALEALPEAKELFTATARPGAPARLSEVESPGPAPVAGHEVGLRVRVVDALGNAIPGAEIGWRALSDGAAVSPSASAASADGVAEARLRTAPRPGANEVEARAAGLKEPLVVSVTTVVGAPARLEVVRGDGQAAASRRPVRASPAVRVVDANGNPVAGVAVRFDVTAGGGALAVGEARTDAKGVATCGAWTLGAPGRNEVRALADGVERPARFAATARRR